MIRAITFDLWQTLLLETPESLSRGRMLRVLGVQKTLLEVGYDAPLSRIERAYEAAGVAIEATWRTQADVSSWEQVQILLGCLDGNLVGTLDETTWAQLAQVYASPVLSAMPFLNEEALEVLSTLKQNGFKVGLICNTGRTPGSIVRVVLDRFGILGFFDTLTFSDELRLRKPNPRIFLNTLARLGVSPVEALHVGDDLDADIAGARGTGMGALWLRRGGNPPGEDGIIGRLPQLLEVLGQMGGAKG